MFLCMSLKYMFLSHSAFKLVMQSEYYALVLYPCVYPCVHLGFFSRYNLTLKNTLASVVLINASTYFWYGW